MKVKIDIVNDYPDEKTCQGDFDLLVNGFNDCKKIKYGKELRGETENLKKLCRLSENAKKTIISGFDTDNFGIIKHSAGVFDRGKLLGISDTSVAFEDSDYMPGGGGKLFNTSCGKIAVAVGDDIYSFGLFKAFAICGAEITVAICNQKRKEINSVLIRAYSYLTGVPTLLVFDGGAYASDTSGNLTSISPGQNTLIDLEPYGEYTLKTTKIRLNK